VTALSQSEGQISSKMAELKIRPGFLFAKSPCQNLEPIRLDWGARDPINDVSKTGTNFWVGRMPYTTVLSHVSLYPRLRQILPLLASAFFSRPRQVGKTPYVTVLAHIRLKSTSIDSAHLKHAVLGEGRERKTTMADRSTDILALWKKVEAMKKM